MEMLLGALAIFGLRIVDVSLGTVKLLYLVRGDRLTSSILAFIESAVWLVAASLVFDQLYNLVNMFAFAAGFAAGTAVGMSVERWIATGYVLVRVISREKSAELLAALRENGFGVTALPGEGRAGGVKVLMVVTLRRRGQAVLRLIQQCDPQAFVTVDEVNKAVGGYIPRFAIPASVRK